MPAPTLPPLEQPVTRQTNYCLLSSCLQGTDGTGPTVDLGVEHTGLLVVSMCINHVLENEKLSVSIWGSTDGNNWGDKPLVALPPKSYCGIYSTFLNLAALPQIRYLRASWNMVRWGRGYGGPLFGFQVSAQESATRAA